MITTVAYYAATVQAFAADSSGSFKMNTSPHQTMPYISATLATASKVFADKGVTMVKDDIEATSLAQNGSPLPDLGILIGGNTSKLLRTIKDACNQHKLTAFLRAKHPHNDIICNLLQINLNDRARIGHLTWCEFGKHNDTRLDIKKASIKHASMAVYSRIIPHGHQALSQYQARPVVSLQLGLPVQSLQDRCRCGELFSSDGGHALCCKQWAGKSWVRGHDGIVEQVGYEIKRVGIPVTTDKNFITRHCSHFSDRSTGDGYVQANRSQAIKVRPT
jgi:hypothetical protein